MYLQAKKSKDSNRFFSTDKKSGILIQHSFKRAIYFVDNINIDEFQFNDETKVSDLEKWIEAKKKNYQEQVLINS